MIFNRNKFFRVASFFLSDWFGSIVLSSMIGLCVFGIMVPVQKEPSIIPSMETWSLHRWAYVLGLPNHVIFWGLVILGFIYWVVLLCRSVPQWKKLISFSSEKISDYYNQPFYLREQFELPYDLELSAHHMRRELVRRGFHVREQQTGSEIYFSAEKHRINRWAHVIIHFGIFLVIIGIGIYGFQGIREDVHISIGTEEQILAEPVVVNMDYFKASYYPHTRKLFSYEADISVTQFDQSLTSSVRLYAGKPGMLNGVRYHMLDFGQTLRDAIVEMHFKGRRERTRILRLSFGKDEPIRHTPWVVRLEKFTPDFIMSEGKVTTRSMEWKNPAVLVSIFSGRKLKFKQWLFKKYETDSFFEKKVSLFFRLNQLNSGNYITLRFSRSPGILIIWFGMLFVGAGLCIMYFFCYRAIWALIEGKGEKSSIVMAGESSREHVRFPGYFEKLVKKLRNV